MCRNPKSPSYKYYGGRGISYDPRWDDWDTFVFDVESEIGKLPFKKANFDRIDNDQGFFPGNIKWSTVKENHNNQRSNFMITAQGITLNLKGWEERTGINEATLWSRINDYGWSPEDAVKYPPYKRKLKSLAK